MDKAEILQMLAALLLGTIPVASISWKIFGVIAGLRAEIADLRHRLNAADEAIADLQQRYDKMAIKVKIAVNSHNRRLLSIEQFLNKAFSYAPRDD
jgi:sulfite reductase beta subunit-like hemoprotein